MNKKGCCKEESNESDNGAEFGGADTLQFQSFQKPTAEEDSTTNSRNNRSSCDETSRGR